MKSFKSLLIIIAIFIVIAITVGIVIIGNKANTKQQTAYEIEIINIAKDYYSNYYYDLINDPVVALQEVSDTGIIFPLDTLTAYKELTDKTKKILDGAKCDYTASRVIIHPESPFDANSMSTEVFLDCEGDI